MSGAIFVYVTCASREEARLIARALVDERLVACANLRPHESIYRWNGAVESAEEWGLVLKTTAAAWERVASRVNALHSYKCPCIVALPVAAGHAPFLDWIRGEVSA